MHDHAISGHFIFCQMSRFDALDKSQARAQDLLTRHTVIFAVRTNKNATAVAVAFFMGRADALSAPYTQQCFQLRIAYQPLGIATVKQTSWVGRPDPFASRVSQPLRQCFERLMIHCRWAQSRLTCCIHVYTYSWPVSG